MGNGLMNRKNQILMFGLLIVGLACSTTKAGFVLVTTRTDLNATGQLNLATLGPAGTTLPTSTNITANTGEVVTITQASGSPQRVDQSAPVFGWNGNFLPGEALIWTIYGGPVTYNFGANKVSSFGYQIQPDVYAGRFTAFISVLDDNNNEIARFTRDGASSGTPNGSALFIGVAATDSSSYFSRIRFGIQTGGNPLNFAYNSPSFAIVPEPGTVVLGVISACALVIVKKRRGVARKSV
jgi:hypothetical protein